MKLNKFEKKNVFTKCFTKYYLVLKYILVIIFFAIFITNLNPSLKDIKNKSIIPLVKEIKNPFKNYKQRKYKIIGISYANELYRKQLELNKKSAVEVGKVDKYYSYGPDDLDKDFREKNKHILSRQRGNGYWLWKSYIINKTIVEKLNDDDFLIYTDAGTIYMNNSQILIDFMEENKFSIWMNKLNWNESQWTKRDAFILKGH